MARRILGLVSFLFLLVGTVYAQNSMDQSGIPTQGQQEGQEGSRMGGQENGPPSVPPQFAIDACTGKSEGATCQAGREGVGVCSYTPDRKYFACKPNNMSSEGQHGPGGRGDSGDNGVKDNQDGTVTGTF